MQLLLVCTGNTCRSPMAEALLKKMLPATAECEVTSAGLHAFDGSAAAYHALLVLKERGIDFSNFRSQSLSYDLVDKSDRIFVMTQHHYQEILRHYPQAKQKLFLLTECLNKEDIPDPIGGSLSVYQACASYIEKALLHLLPKLLVVGSSLKE